VGVAGCARPGPQVPDAMPTSIARQVSEWQVRESEVRECVLVKTTRPPPLRSWGQRPTPGFPDVMTPSTGRVLKWPSPYIREISTVNPMLPGITLYSREKALVIAGEHS
jgi:hypothetical protein